MGKHTERRLTVEFLNYWHAGSGRSSGYHLDALCERDSAELPILSGRQLKGLLRHAVHRAESWGWLADIALPAGPLSSHEELLFGSRAHSEQRNSTQPGILLTETAQLPRAEHEYLAHEENSELRAELFGELFSTAINENGSAQRYSLRGLEVSLPLTLHAGLRLDVTTSAPALRTQQETYIQTDAAWRVLETALPLLDALGAYRSRGLGEARVTLDCLNEQGA